MVPGVQEQLFIAPPPDPRDDFYARRWAQGAGVAILPLYACNEQMLNAQPQQAQAAPPGVTAYISEPAPGQTYAFGENISIKGTASFTGVGGFYKVEIRGGSYGDWTTLGDVNNWKNQSGVVDGVLEQIGGGLIAPGSYQVQLVVVGQQGNVLTTVASSFNVSG